MARSLRVLVVEDDKRVRALIEDLLASVATVESAEDLEQARRLLGASPRRRFDLAIVDCLLAGSGGTPTPHGVELMEELHRERPAMPILAITGAGHLASVIVDAFRNGARDVLFKPFNIVDLREAVERLTRPTGGRRAAARPAPARAGVARVLTFLAEHPGEPLSLSALARIASMSPSHLSRTFRVTVGMPLRVYVSNVRLQRAKDLLLTSPRASLTEVAIEAGFYDLPHFDKAFRERFGVSPSEYLRRAQQAGAVKARRARG